MADRIRSTRRTTATIGPLPPGDLPADYPDTGGEAAVRSAGPGGSGMWAGGLSPEGVRFLLWLREQQGRLGDAWDRFRGGPLVAGPPPVAPRDDEELIRRLNPARRTVEGPMLYLPGEPAPNMPGLDLRAPAVPPVYDRRLGEPLQPRQGYFPSNEDLILSTEAARRMRRRRT